MSLALTNVTVLNVTKLNNAATINNDINLNFTFNIRIIAPSYYSHYTSITDLTQLVGRTGCGRTGCGRTGGGRAGRGRAGCGRGGGAARASRSCSRGGPRRRRTPPPVGVSRTAPRPPPAQMTTPSGRSGTWRGAHAWPSYRKPASRGHVRAGGRVRAGRRPSVHDGVQPEASREGE